MTARRYLATATAVLAALCASGALASDESAPGSVLDQVVVTATRIETTLIEVPASVAVRDLAELRADGFTFGTDEYRGVPGVFFRRGEGDGDEFPFVSFRGSLGTEGSLSMIDGVPLVGLYEETQLNEVPYDAIERIEIVKGPVSALYGRGALYGATNYITRSAREARSSATLTLGGDDYVRGDVALSRALAGGGGILGSASYEDYGGWREQGGRRILNLFGKLEADLGERTSLTSYATYTDRDSELPNGIPLDADGELIPFAGGREGFLGFEEPRTQSDSLMLGARLQHAVQGGPVLALTAHGREIERTSRLNFFDPFGVDLSRGVIGMNGFLGDTRQRVAYLEGTARWDLDRVNVIAGVTGERSRITEVVRWTGQNGFTPECGFTFFLVEIDAIGGNVLNDDHPCFVRDALQTDARFENRFWGAFAQAEIDLAERWRATLGGRWDSFRREAEYAPIAGVTLGGAADGRADAFSPKAALSYLPDWGQLYFAYGRGFNSNFGATFEWDPVQYARPETRPTTIDSYELGAKGRAFGDALQFEAAVYYTRQKNRRQIIPNPAAETDFTAPFSLVTFGDLYEGRGAELSLRAQPREGTDLTITYSFIDPEWGDYVIQTFGGPVDLSGSTPTGVPQHTFYVALTQRVSDWLVARAAVEAYDDYYYTQDNAFKDGGHTLLTLGATIQPATWRGLRLDLTVMNALDEEYYSFFGTRNRPTYAMPGPPRQVRAILTASF
jgi:outer membrane receptor protein involved in Fe transport